MSSEATLHFVSLGLFIIDEFRFLGHDESNTKETIGGGGIFASIGARIWLPPNRLGMVVDRGNDFPVDAQLALEKYGRDMWAFRDVPQRPTTRSLSTFQDGHREFQYLTARPPTTLIELQGTKLQRPRMLHFICAASEALSLVKEIELIPDWTPITVYEPVPFACTPSELPLLLEVLPRIDILSPNSKEAMELLSIADPPSKEVIERACAKFLDHGVGPEGRGHVVIRCDEMGAYVACRQRAGVWVDAFWTKDDSDKVVDVTGAGNNFLGGLAAGLYYTGDVYEAVFYAAVSASFTIEQAGLPKLTHEVRDTSDEEWNGESPLKRLQLLKQRHALSRFMSGKLESAGLGALIV